MFCCLEISQAGTNVTLPFSSTFNCPESVQTSWGSYDDIAGCPGWQGDGGSPTSNGSYDRISSSDNNPDGEGGRGWGHAVGDGQNNNGGSIRITFAPQSELWIRFYMRYPSGFTWAGGLPGYQKILYINPPGHVAEFTGDEIGYYNETLSTHSASSAGWPTIMGGSTGDGQWHAYEWHIKIGNPGIMETWVDGALVHSNTSINTGSTPISVLNILTNQNQPANGGDRYISIDDFAISNTGYIGLLSGGGGDTTPPTVSITSPVDGSTVSGSTTISATASDDVAVAGVQFKVDGNNIGSEDTSSPYSISWDTTSASNGSHSFTAVARDTSNNTTTSSSVSVTVSNVSSTPTVSLTASSTSIVYGNSSTLTWSSTNTTSCTASNGWTGTKATSGSQSVTPSSTNTYVLTCTGTGGSASSSTTVSVTGTPRTVFFSEGFEDTNFSSRGWYDSTGGTVTTSEYYSGSHSFQCTYNSGTAGCATGGPGRHLFTDNNSVYMSYWVKYSSNFVGSGVSYHPHEFYFLTNLNDPYEGLSFDYLTMYLESHWSSSSSGTMQVGFQDGQNIDQARIGQNLIGVTENRAVAGCNGSPSGYSGVCYDRGDGSYVNGVILSSSAVFTSGNKNNWNNIESYYQLNSIVNGIGQSDGIIRLWVNGILVFERTDAILRTGYRPTMKINQLILGPYIGDGSPVTQTMWIDDLVVASERSSIINLLPPTNIRIIVE